VLSLITLLNYSGGGRPHQLTRASDELQGHHRIANYDSCMDFLVKEASEILLAPSNFDRHMGFALIHSRHMTTKKEVHNGSTSNVGHDD
jgi:hypothetical protein